MSASFGRRLKLQVFGESHGPALGMVLDGLPAGEAVDEKQLRRFLARRAPGQTPWSSPRREEDRPEFVSGLLEGQTCGAPLCALIYNQNHNSADYLPQRHLPRPGHADYSARLRFGEAADWRGGGHFSGRVTAALCLAGGVCLQLLQRRQIYIGAHIAEIGGIADSRFDAVSPTREEILLPGQWTFPVINQKAGASMEACILAAKEAGDSVGGLVEGAAIGLPGGLGGPLFAGLESQLAAAMLAIPGAKGVEFGAGFAAARLHGSENNDAFRVKEGRIVTETNQAGGLLGGITTGMPVVFQVAFKPTPSISKPQRSVDLKRMVEIELSLSGRHDPCLAPRAVPVVEALTAFVLLDTILEQKGDAPWQT